MNPPPRPLLFRPPRTSPRFLSSIRPPSLFHHHSGPSVYLHPPLPFDFMLLAPYSLFEIRLETDVIILRGGQDEAQDYLLKGVVVLCLQSPLRVEEVSLELVGALCHPWAETEPLIPKTTLLEHKWPPFIGSRHSSTSLPAGNYEWPFEFMLPGSTAETVEGMSEACISYRLKATISRPKLLRAVYTRKRLRVFRTPSPDTLEMMQSLPIERTWLNKIDYFVNLSTGVVMHGGSVILEMRLSPVIKGLSLEHFSVMLMEFREFHFQNRTLFPLRDHRTERTISTWNFQVLTDHNRQDMLEGTGQQVWSITQKLDIPNRLSDCIPDMDVHGIRVQHKVRVVIPLRNADGHISELAVGLPLFITINTNIPFDEQRSANNHLAFRAFAEDNTNPPGYGEHILDQLFDELPQEEVQSTGGIQARTGGTGQSPEFGGQGMMAPGSSESFDMDSDEMEVLSQVPTYRTALRTPLRFHRHPGNIQLPAYDAAARSSRQDQVD
ncbi:hypothetical protein B0J15DRAFT_506257 [Fusarium solani]|uniref:Arrestin C-terminal-like domain-containing protein n=1 Tax=Fusarium solani TaxID=169388 RepID=A0A9P9FZY3_FUSSL|nr:uncharacterized protein B0J15DRAFT_506257 [Fusarium solani]KAH7230740.1 hypothetical protein B0J15DRAFT_506257 [Fusarium solani]